MGVIYCYTNKINNKKYVGQTINPEQRFIQHKSSAFNPKDKDYEAPLHRAFRKYGYENFSYQILAEAETIEELNGLEIYYIAHLNTKIPNGYNILDGGRNEKKPKSKETKDKLMKAHAKLSEQEIIVLRKAYANHSSPKQIYNELYKTRMHYNSFLNIWSGQRYKTIMPEVFKERDKHTKLNAEIVKNIRKDREENKISYQNLAKKYNISKSTIADIITKRTWKNV